MKYAKNDKSTSKGCRSQFEEPTTGQIWDNLRSKSIMIGMNYTPLNKISF